MLVSTEHNAWDSYSLPTRLLNASLHHRDRRRWAVSPRVRDSVWPVSRKGVDVLVHGIVPQDVDQQMDRTAVRAGVGAGPDDVIGITVANFRTEKAYPDLLAAARTALDEEPRLRLLIVGQGPLDAEIRRRHEELRLGDRCRILGYRADVMQLLSASDFFVLASHFEGFPIALMEAMATGLPAVATRVGGVPDAVRDGEEGFIIEPARPEALAHAMVRMVRDDRSRLEMAERARVRGQQFDVRHAIRTIEEAYSTLASPTAGG